MRRYQQGNVARAHFACNGLIARLARNGFQPPTAFCGKSGNVHVYKGKGNALRLGKVAAERRVAVRLLTTDAVMHVDRGDRRLGDGLQHMQKRHRIRAAGKCHCNGGIRGQAGKLPRADKARGEFYGLHHPSRSVSSVRNLV